MADPLSIGASVVGLIASAATITSILTGFVGDVKDAPSLARHVMSEVYAISAAISSLQGYLWGEAQATNSQKSMILVEHLAVTLTGCVFTFSELETEVAALKSNYNMKTLERVKWARKRGTISQIFTRLQNHKSSLTLMLDILQSKSDAQAEENLGELCISVGHILESQRDISERLQRLETGVGPAQSFMTGGRDSDMSSLRTLQRTTSRETIGNLRFRFAFDTTLYVSRVYRRSAFRYPKHSRESMTSSVAAQSMGWSFMSGLSLSDISQISVFSLPIYPFEIPNSQHYTAVWETLRNVALWGQTDLFRMLLKVGGADILDQKDNCGLTVLHHAARGGHKGVVQILLEKGNVEILDQRDNYGWTVLHHATRDGHKDVVQILLEKGDVDILDQRDNYGWTGLHLATWEGHEDVVQILLEKGGIDILGQEDNDGRTALHFAAWKGYKNIVQMLLEKGGADILDQKDNYGRTALHFTAWKERKDVIQVLFEKGGVGTLDQKDNYGCTALHLAARGGYKDVVQMLLEKGADTSIMENSGHGSTALDFAVEAGHEGVVWLLLDKGADISVQNKLGSRVLHRAAHLRNAAVVRLLKRGADISATTNTGLTELSLEELQGHKDVQVLFEEGAARG